MTKKPICRARFASRITSNEGITPSWTWIGEPTEFRLIDSHKGVGYLETKITGVPGHSGKPDKGLNAIDIGAQFVGILKRDRQNEEEKPFANSRFDPPYTTFNSGIIEGGTAENIIAEHCRIVWQVRSHPGDDLGKTLREVEHMRAEEIKPRFAPSRRVRA